MSENHSIIIALKKWEGGNILGRVTPFFATKVLYNFLGDVR